MTRRRAIFWLSSLLIALLLSVPSVVHASDYSYARVVRLSLVNGSVSIAHTGDSTWQPALANMPIEEGDTIASGAGCAEVEFESGAVAFLSQNSILQFTQLSLSEGGRLSQLTVTQGTAGFYASLGNADTFEVLTPSLSVTLAGNAEFRVNANENGSSVTVFKGTIDVNSSAGMYQVHKEESLSLAADDAQNLSVVPNSKPDDFDRWVSQESDAIAIGDSDSHSYLNSLNSFGAADLYSYGSWLDCPNYGACWQPFGIAAGWSPYTDGFWSMYPEFGWTWISFEPWGWMPYHFGAWMMEGEYGWVWVPTSMAMWSPALVDWVTVGNQVGWVPVSPLDKAGAAPVNLRQGVIVNSGSFNSRIVGANGQGRIAEISQPPSTFRSAAAPRSVSIDSPFSQSGSRALVFDHASHSFVSASSASTFTGPRGRPVSGGSAIFATRPAGPPPGARGNLPSSAAVGGMGGGSRSAPAAAPAGGAPPSTSASQGSSGTSPHH